MYYSISYGHLMDRQFNECIHKKEGDIKLGMRGVTGVSY